MSEKRKKYQVDGDKLRAARKQAALSVEALSRKALVQLSEDGKGFSVSDIQKYEKGGAYIYADKLKILATILGVKPEGIVFFDTPEQCSQTPQFRAWYGFVESTHSYKDKYVTLVLYKKYMKFVFSYCQPSWDALSKRNSTEEKAKDPPKTLNAIYAFTKKIGLRKADFLFTHEILIAINGPRNELMLKIIDDRHISEKFRRVIEKHLQLLDKIGEQIKFGAVRYKVADLEQLKICFSMLNHYLSYAKLSAAKSIEEYGGGDWGAFREEIYDQIMHAELDGL